MHLGKRLIAALGGVVSVLVLSAGTSSATLMTFTDSANFFANLPGPATTLNFNSTPSGTSIASGGTLGGITFTFDFGGVQLAVTDGNQFGGGGPFDTTSPTNFLGTNDADVLQDGDSFDLSFNPVNAIGMFFISADVFFDGDITLSAGSGSVGLVAADVQQVLPDGGEAFFLGIVDNMNTFTAASIVADGGPGGPFFLYNVDGITTAAVAVPEPGTLYLMIVGLLFVVTRWRAYSILNAS